MNRVVFKNIVGIKMSKEAEIKRVEEIEKSEFSLETQEYFEELSVKIGENYSVAEKARAKGLDPSDKVEVPLALTMAAKVIRLIATKYSQLDREDLIDRLLELEKKYGALEASVAFKIAEEIAQEKYCKFETQLEAIDAGIRVGFAYLTLGVVSSPIEGFTEIKTGKTQTGESYLKAYFSGPIRSAGTTASCVVLMLIDYMRQLFGYAKYDPTELEIKRFVTELLDYHERVTNLQYCPTEEEAEFIARNMPFQICGDPTESREVSNYKNLPRVDTDFIRGGFCLVAAEGMAQKAAKGLRLLKKVQKNGFKINDWEWLDEYVELHEKQTMGKGDGDSTPTYIKDLVAGRPVLGHPGKGFRFRYGRSRVAGFSAVSIHPASMAMTDDIIGFGTQLKIEKPTKGCVTTPCDSIDGPIVKFQNGSVRKLDDYEEAKMLYNEVEEIIYLGDILFPLGDVMNRNAVLIKPGYVEEWWGLELEKILGKKGLEGIDVFNVDFNKAVEFSKQTGIAFYPKYIFYWNQINYIQFLGFIDWLEHARVNNGKLLFPYNSSEKERFKIGKRALELLGIEHFVSIENVILENKDKEALFVNLGFDSDFEGEIKFDSEQKSKDFSSDHSNPNEFPSGNLKKGFKGYRFKKYGELFGVLDGGVDGGGESEKKIDEKLEGEKVLEIVNELSKFKIKDKAGEFIGCRMGRPEKAKLRKLTGSPNIIFPVGEEGGRFKSVLAAADVGYVKGDFPFNYCGECKKESIYKFCEDCGGKTEKKYYCRMCQQEVDTKCKVHDIGANHKQGKIDMADYFEKARKRIGVMRVEVPEMIKGLKTTSSENHEVEHLSKGILRAKHNLCVNKDGTVRYDMTELPLSHFKPKEIEVGVSKLRELGYVKDCYGNELKDDNQILELKPHDVLIPCNIFSGDERGDDVFMNIANFVDELLVKFYGLDAFYNIKSRDDLLGHMVVCMAPHNCAGVIGRIIGFAKAQGLMASPYMHAAMRRDCVYPSTNFVYETKEGIKSEKIGDFVERLIKKGNSIKQADSHGTIEVGLNEENLFAFGVDPITKKLKKKKIKHFIKGEAPEKWIKIKTASGREQIMTPRHKFIYLDDENNFKVKKASEIRRGDKIGVLREFNMGNDVNSINLLDALSSNVPTEKQGEIRIVEAESFFKEIVRRVGVKKVRQLVGMIGFNNLFDWYKLIPLNHAKKLVDEGYFKWSDLPSSTKIRTIFNNKEWELDLKFGEGLMRIMGCYSAEGYCRQNKTVSQVCFRIMENGQRERLVKDIQNVFGFSPSFGEEKTKITICNKLVYYLFRYVFDLGYNAYNKKVADLIYNVSRENVLAYLSAYFDGDGTIINSNGRRVFTFYSVSRELLQGVSLLLTRWKLFGRFLKTGSRLPGRKVLERYKELGKEPKTHILNHLVYSGKDFFELVGLLKSNNFEKMAKLNNVQIREARRRKILFDKKYYDLQEIGDVYIDIIKEITSFEEEVPSYCFEIENNSEEDKNVLWGEGILNARCDGDEAAMMMLLDVLINFSRGFLPSHRGGTQDAPLVLNGKIYAREVDDQILDFELVNSYPLELYEKAEQKLHSGEIEIEMVKQRIGRGEDPYVNTGFTHNSENFNDGALCSSYKTLPSMREKVEAQMQLCEKLRAVDHGDVARLIIDRHFMRDLKGNLRKFTQQTFRCSSCNEIHRRPPLNGNCINCNKKLIFTISYGGIVKYLEPGLDLARNYDVPLYIKQDLELTKKYIESIFGRDTEKQESIEKWF